MDARAGGAGHAERRPALGVPDPPGPRRVVVARPHARRAHPRPAQPDAHRRAHRRPPDRAVRRRGHPPRRRPSQRRRRVVAVDHRRRREPDDGPDRHVRAADADAGRGAGADAARPVRRLRLRAARHPEPAAVRAQPDHQDPPGAGHGVHLHIRLADEVGLHVLRRARPDARG